MPRTKLLISFFLILVVYATSVNEPSQAASSATCWVSAISNGMPVSVASGTEPGKSAMSWIRYQAPFTQKLKFLVKFPAAANYDKHSAKMSSAAGLSFVDIPFAFPWNDLNQGTASVKVNDDFGSCSLSVELVDNGFESTDVSKAIPDGTGAFVESEIVVKDISLIEKVRVSIQINHEFDQDLVIELIGPDATTVQLASQRGSGPNFGTGFAHSQRTVFDDAAPISIGSGSSPFVGTFVPDQPLSGFNGKFGTAANGIWKLRVTDLFAVFTGTIINWALIIDDPDGTTVTWNRRLTKEMFLDAGFTSLTAQQELKLQNTIYTINSIVNGSTDRLVDSLFCTGCHTGLPSQTPNRYLPNYPVTPANAHFQDKTFTSTYTWNDFTSNGIVPHFQTNPINKPPALKAIITKWLNDGAQ